MTKQDWQTKADNGDFTEVDALLAESVDSATLTEGTLSYALLPNEKESVYLRYLRANCADTVFDVDVLPKYFEANDYEGDTVLERGEGEDCLLCDCHHHPTIGCVRKLGDDE